MSSRQPNMANMAQRNTQQGAARQQQNQPFMAQNGNAFQFNNLQQQQLRIRMASGRCSRTRTR
ncbi:hypothetical protein FOXG_21292 [Fusarium oxysporum f. sp. lycopersici 4287]|uniref:Uncharacterized protein n=1 Tax=Fusarium oxysporum f. sp. lycopersici (strain 4287 / CBS 123668 / FGSC 9935 / NRRL 34936) TaxID=426428 RepID=A0A0J9VWF5_FUSO4|nr:hypothetical protein FOXG_21292 [Fusarium oxysporum f. sp. lycopersici 4287]KNB15294.1 hypothetical protein FOXG_21292 [Fusarium oxysporum f. sp. lycopersici 4287]